LTFSEIGFVSHNLLFLIEEFSAKGTEAQRIQNEKVKGKSRVLFFHSV
jgi:hypothetical protein